MRACTRREVCQGGTRHMVKRHVERRVKRHAKEAPGTTRHIVIEYPGLQPGRLWHAQAATRKQAIASCRTLRLAHAGCSMLSRHRICTAGAGCALLTREKLSKHGMRTAGTGYAQQAWNMRSRCWIHCRRGRCSGHAATWHMAVAACLLGLTRSCS